MYILLRQLAQLRRDAGLTRPSTTRPRALSHVDAGSCNGCEHELGLVISPLYDLERHGLEVVAAPRDADVLLVTGAVTSRMAGALRIAFDAMPEPRLVAALGDCALNHGVLGDPSQLARPLEALLPVDIRIPGCPPSPRVIAEHLLAILTPVARSAADGSSEERASWGQRAR